MLCVPAFTSVCGLCSMFQPLSQYAFLCSVFQPLSQYAFLCSVFQPWPRYAFYARCSSLTSVCVLCSIFQPWLQYVFLCSMFQPWLQYAFLCSMFQPLPRYAFYARCFSLRAITCNFGIYCPRLVALLCALCEVSSDMTWGLKSMSDNYKVNTSVWYLR